MLKPNFEETDGLGINDHWGIPKLLWVHLKILSIPKNLRTLKTNFDEADGLGIRLTSKIAFVNLSNNSANKLPFKIGSNLQPISDIYLPKYWVELSFNN